VHPQQSTAYTSTPSSKSCSLYKRSKSRTPVVISHSSELKLFLQFWFSLDCVLASEIEESRYQYQSAQGEKPVHVLGGYDVLVQVNLVMPHCSAMEKEGYRKPCRVTRHDTAHAVCSSLPLLLYSVFCQNTIRRRTSSEKYNEERAIRASHVSSRYRYERCVARPARSGVPADTSRSSAELPYSVSENPRVVHVVAATLPIIWPFSSCCKTDRHHACWNEAACNDKRQALAKVFLSPRAKATFERRGIGAYKSGEGQSLVLRQLTFRCPRLSG